MIVSCGFVHIFFNVWKFGSDFSVLSYLVLVVHSSCFPFFSHKSKSETSKSKRRIHRLFHGQERPEIWREKNVSPKDEKGTLTADLWWETALWSTQFVESEKNYFTGQELKAKTNADCAQQK